MCGYEILNSKKFNIILEYQRVLKWLLVIPVFVNVVLAFEQYNLFDSVIYYCWSNFVFTEARHFDGLKLQ